MNDEFESRLRTQFQLHAFDGVDPTFPDEMMEKIAQQKSPPLTKPIILTLAMMVSIIFFFALDGLHLVFAASAIFVDRYFKLGLHSLGSLIVIGLILIGLT